MVRGQGDVPLVIAEGDFSAMACIVTEQIPGNSLLELYKSAPLPVPEVVALSGRMASALHELHKQHVVHQDLKPDNLLQRPDGTIMFIDFGLSCHDQLPDLLAEEFSIPMGTFPCIAPEQYLRQRDDLRSDIFALGAMIQELATGEMSCGRS